MSDSRKLLDAWLPPEGAGRAIACLATSYTFDPDFFESDCLARFLALDWKRGEDNDFAFMIEQEERLAEARATVLVDRGYNPEARSLRWDILPIGVRGGVFHPKVSLLVWEHVIRVIVGSANLTSSGYRSQLECGVVLDVFDRSGLPTDFVMGFVEALREVVRLAPGDPDEAGPKQRAVQTLEYAAQRIHGLDTPHALAGKIRATAVTAGSGRAALQQLEPVWRGGPPRRAVVLSPFFDTAEGKSEAAVALGSLLAQRGHAEVTFVVPVETVETRMVVRAPKSLMRSLPSRIRTDFRAVASLEDDLRRLHAKVLLLESDEWITALVGSSNFTTAGLGLRKGSGNVEINLAIGAPARSAEAEALRSLVPIGDPIELDTVEWAPEQDDELGELQLPAGFIECLLHPGTPPVLILRLAIRALPERWLVRSPEGQVLVDRSRWVREESPPELRVPLVSGETPFFVYVEWSDGNGPHRAGWPINVTEPGLLPPPEELRDLPVEALLRALASTRPLYESLVNALRELRAMPDSGDISDLDPLKRYSASGQLFQRTRRLSAALSGLRRRLERPASNLDALVWRLEGPFGPKAVAEGLLRDIGETRGAIKGEASFLIAELALTLARVDWDSTARILGIETVQRHARKAIDDVRELAEQRLPADRRLKAYVKQALAESKL
jgi:hypothetical protein